MPSTILIQRHGQIAANRQGRWHGSTDSKLTWRGRRQARRAAAALAGDGVRRAALYCSPLTRCLQTAEPIASALELRVEVVEDLREWCIGDWEDTSFRELNRTHEFPIRVRQDPRFEPPGGESLASVAERTAAALRAIDARHDEPVVVVSHGACIAAAIAQLVDEDAREWSQYLVENCAHTELVVRPSPYLNFFNRTHHL